ncbi:MAG TPA: divergent polysaccharide deacetylase family protein [Candidatus Deferrimicrobiaceae bacterium]|nr:divergent polysaccharide deacetylase family protein [Candidatus Deferrimicrobiaceae bacterium]
MPARVWQALAGIIVLLLVAVVTLDRWQARSGEASLFGPDLFGRAPRRAATPAPAIRSTPEPAPPPPGAPRIAVIVDDLGGRRDVFDVLREIRRPLTVAVLPALPLSAAIARDAARAGMEVLLGLPMEPYRYPEVDPGPGALMMSMPPGEIQQLVGRHLEAVAPAVGVVNRMGSRLTEDRPRMRAVLEVLAARRLFLVDAYTSSQSVAFDEARDAGVRAARRQILVDHARGEAGDRAHWDEVAGWAERRGEVIVVAHGHPLTVRLLKEYVPRWEARGLRLVPVSQLAR